VPYLQRGGKGTTIKEEGRERKEISTAYGVEMLDDAVTQRTGGARRSKMKTCESTGKQNQIR